MSQDTASLELQRPTFGVEIEFLIAMLPEGQQDPHDDVQGLAPVLFFPEDEKDDAEDLAVKKVEEMIQECFGTGPQKPTPAPLFLDGDHSPLAHFQTWNVDNDGTVFPGSLSKVEGGYKYVSVEISSPVQYATPEGFAAIDFVITSITSKFRCIVNRSCGLHVHVGIGAERMPLEHIRRIASLSYAVEPLLFTLHDPVRRINQFSQSLREFSVLAKGRLPQESSDEKLDDIVRGPGPADKPSLGFGHLPVEVFSNTTRVVREKPDDVGKDIGEVGFIGDPSNEVYSRASDTSVRGPGHMDNPSKGFGQIPVPSPSRSRIDQNDFQEPGSVVQHDDPAYAYQFRDGVFSCLHYLGRERRHGEAPLSVREKMDDIAGLNIKAFLNTRRSGHFEPFIEAGGSRNTSEIRPYDISEHIDLRISKLLAPTTEATSSAVQVRQRGIPRVILPRYNEESYKKLIDEYEEFDINAVPESALDDFLRHDHPISVFEATKQIYSQPASCNISHLLSGETRPSISLNAYQCHFLKPLRNNLRTVEFRLGEGSLDGGWISTWAKICVGLFRFALYASPSQFTDLLTNCDRAGREIGVYDVIDLLDEVGLFAEAEVAEKRLVANMDRWNLKSVDK